MIGIIWTFLTTKIPFQAWLGIFAVLSLVGALFWFRHSILVSCETSQQVKELKAKNEALKLSLTEAQQYTAFLLNTKKKNDNFIKKQKKDFYNAKDKDGAVADNVRNTLKRLSDDRKILDK